MAGIKQVSFTSPYSAEEMAIERRKKLAEMLAIESNKPLGTQMLGRVAIQNSPLEGLAKVAKAGASAYLGNKSEEMQKELGERARSERTQALARAMQMMQGSPGSPMPPDEQGGGPALPAQAPDQMGALQALAQSNDPSLQAAGTGALLQRMMPQKPIVLGRTLIDPANPGKPLAVDSTWQEEQENNRQAREAELRQKAADARATEAQREAARRELAQMNIDARREMAGQANALRRDLNAGRREDRQADLAARREDRKREIEQKRQDKLEQTQGKQDQGKSRVTVNLSALNEYYDELENLGAVVDSSKSGAENLSARVRSSGVGQAIGGAVGSEEQVWRGNINQMRPLLLQEIRQASAMGARGLDSNKELEFYLQAATDPSKDIKTNRAAISVLEKAYGLGSIVKGADPAAVAALRNQFKGGGAAPAGGDLTPEERRELEALKKKHGR